MRLRRFRLNMQTRDPDRWIGVNRLKSEFFCPFHLMFIKNKAAASALRNATTVTTRVLRFVRISATAALLTITGVALAAPGALDTTFGLGTGKVITAIGVGNDNANAMAIQPDGKIVLAGGCINGSNNDFCIARYNTDGTLDATFNTTGKVITPIGASDDTASSVAIQPDGKIVLAGYCFNGTDQDFCVARYTAAGALDTTFNATGKVITPIGTDSDYATSVALQPDGKIVVAGYCFVSPAYNFCIARYTAAGALDTTFSTTGKLITPVGAGNNVGNSVAVQVDGKIVVAGYCANGGNQDFCLVRYKTDGSLDTTFNATGKLITGIGANNDYANRVAIQPDAKIVAAGFCYNATANSVCVARFNTDGSFDTAFNGTGKVITSVASTNDDSASVVIQSDGNILTAGTCSNGTNNDFCLVRYFNDGSLDTRLNGTGRVITPIGSGNDFGKSVAVQPDGKIVVAGYCVNGANNDFCLARFDGGSLFASQCSMDIDGDGSVLATTDSLIHARVALGITGPAVVGGINFPSGARRTTWPLIRDFLNTQCGMSLP